MLTNDGLMRTIESLMRMNGLLDREQVSWLVSMNDAFVRMNDAFVLMHASLVRMNDAFVRTKGRHGLRCSELNAEGGTTCGKSPSGDENHPSAAKAGLLPQSFTA